MRFFRTFRFPRWTIPLALLGLGVLAFGLMIPWLGFYWDDWAKILAGRLYGLSGYWAYYAEDRPLSGWTHILLTPILGNRPIAWHAFTLLARWASAVGMWWVLSSLWPFARRQAALAAGLFLVYPIFKQQAAAVTFHQQWLQFALYFLSLGLMIQAVRRPARRWLFTGLALAASLLQLSVTEYFAPLELLRPLILWLLAGEGRPPPGRRLLRTLRAYAPYAAAIAAYGVWRLFLLRLPAGDPYRATTLYNLFASPIPTLLGLIEPAFKDTYMLLFSTWVQIVTLRPEQALFTRYQLVLYAVAALAGVITALFLTHYSDHEPEGEIDRRAFLRGAFLIGIAATLLGLAPAWLTGRFALDDFHSDRYALPAMFGASLLWIGALEWLIHKWQQKVIFISILVALAVGAHFQAANFYRVVWRSQLQFYWQLTWRVPALQPGTAVFSENELFPDQGLFSTSAALNLLYPQPAGREALAYWAYTLAPRFAGQSPAGRDQAVKTTFRTLAFRGSTANAILVNNAQHGGHCLWLLDPSYQDNPYLYDLERRDLALTNPSDILPGPAAPGYPPPDLFGKEPAHGWCYFFEKGELARQMGDWEGVARLADEARSQGFYPDVAATDSPQEWMAFIEGYAHASRWQEAADLTLSAFNQDNRYAAALCSLWRGLGPLDPPAEVTGPISAHLGCP